MENGNAFFQLIINDDQVSLKVYPPVNDGEKIKYDEIINYLKKAGVVNYDIKVINALINETNEVVTKIISNDTIHPVNEMMEIIQTADLMYAIARFFPPSNNGERMGFEEIVRTIKSHGIVYGLDEDVIKEFIERPVYCRSIIVAKGLAVREGKDASVKYLFNTDRSAKPRLNENGSVDFHKLDNIAHVKEEEVLAILTPEDSGDNGKNIRGVDIRPKKVNRIKFKKTNNVKVSEDGLQLIATISGHATLENDSVFVSGLFEIPADVDASTGDIEYEGSIVVKGNVRTGFSLKAKGDITINGVVEGANIEAGGNIVLKYGIQGKAKGSLTAGGNLISKFIESAKVRVEGFIETDTILHSDVVGKEGVFVRGNNGNLIGGHVRATSIIEATSIGSAMGSATNVEVGVDPKVQEQTIKLRKQIKDIADEIETLAQFKQVLERKKASNSLDPNMMIKFRKVLQQLIELKTKQDEINKEYEECLLMLKENANAKILIKKVIYPGVKIIMGEDYLVINDAYDHCQFSKKSGEIKLMSY